MDDPESGWFLCPSRTFPGKLYYFNTRTGEKGWSWTDSPTILPIDGKNDTHMNEPTQNKQFVSQHPFTSQNEQLLSPINNSNSTPRNIFANQFLFEKPNLLLRETVSPQSNSNVLNKAVFKNSFSLRKPTHLHSFNVKSIKCSDATMSYKPVPNNPFSSPRQTKHKIADKCGQPMKRMKTDVHRDTTIFNWKIKYSELNLDNSTLTIQKKGHTKDNLKIDIRFLRNLSNLHTEWHIVPDLDVLLDDFDFLTKFVVQDKSCKIMTAAVVVNRLDSLRRDCRAGDSRVVAERVHQWLANHSICEMNVKNQYDNSAIEDQIIKFCARTNNIHMVLITKKENLRQTAKRNGLHAYCICDLKLDQTTTNNQINNTNTFKNQQQVSNLFLINENDQNYNVSPFNNHIIEHNNNNFEVENLNWKTSKVSTLQKGCDNKDTRPYENIEIKVHKNGTRKIVLNENRNIDNCIENTCFKNLRTTLHTNAESIVDTESDEIIFPIKIPDAQKQVYNFENNSKRVLCNNDSSVTQRLTLNRNRGMAPNPCGAIIFNPNVDSNEFDDKIFLTKFDNYYQRELEEKLECFFKTHRDLQAIVEERIDEFSCFFVQIMEQFIDDIFQHDYDKKFDTPLWLQRGLKCLKEHYCQNKQICAIIEQLITMCGYRIQNGVVRTNIKSDQFIKILGASILLVAWIEDMSQLPEISEYKEMLNNLVYTIRTPEEFPDTVSSCLVLRSQIDDGAFFVENVENSSMEPS